MYSTSNKLSIVMYLTSLSQVQFRHVLNYVKMSSASSCTKFNRAELRHVYLLSKVRQIKLSLVLYCTTSRQVQSAQSCTTSNQVQSHMQSCTTSNQVQSAQSCTVHYIKSSLVSVVLNLINSSSVSTVLHNIISSSVSTVLHNIISSSVSTILFHSD